MKFPVACGLIVGTVVVRVIGAATAAVVGAQMSTQINNTALVVAVHCGWSLSGAVYVLKMVVGVGDAFEFQCCQESPCARRVVAYESSVVVSTTMASVAPGLTVTGTHVGQTDWCVVNVGFAASENSGKIGIVIDW
jgi:hypothetical protein